MPPRASHGKRSGEPPARRLQVRAFKRRRPVMLYNATHVVPQRVTRHGQVTIPKIYRDLLNITVGDVVEFIRVKGGLMLRPKKVITVPPDQAWYWTPAWQKSERQADADKRAGRYSPLSSVDDLDKL